MTACEPAYVVRTGYLRRSVTFDGSDVDPDGPDIDPEWDPIGAYRQHKARQAHPTSRKEHPSMETPAPLPYEFTLGINDAVRASDTPTAILSVNRDEDFHTVLTVGEVTVEPAVGRGTTRNVREIHLTKADADALLAALLDRSYGEHARLHGRLWADLVGVAVDTVPGGPLRPAASAWLRYHGERMQDSPSSGEPDDLDRLRTWVSERHQQEAALPAHPAQPGQPTTRAEWDAYSAARLASGVAALREVLTGGPLTRYEISQHPEWYGHGGPSDLTAALDVGLNADPPWAVRTQNGKQVMYDLTPAA